MKKTEVVKKYAKALKGDKLKSYILAICGGIITGLMYKVGASAGANATYKSLAELCPEESYIDADEDEKDTN